MLIIALISLCSVNLFGQNYQIKDDTKTFMPQKKKVLLFSKKGQAEEIILFNSKLRVNTDGNIKSYHPDDLSGEIKAINSICNGISVYRLDSAGKRIGEIRKCAEKKPIFDQFKARNYVEPKGYKIVWQNVLAARNGKPCIFQKGEAKGFFGSLTSEQNGLSAAESGECDYKNQLDAVTIPNLVLPAKTWTDAQGKIHKNPLYDFNAQRGDIVFAYNPANKTWSYAIIGDSGPPDNLGEGSVALNMKLKRIKQIPTNYTKAKELDTGTNKILVAIIPASNSKTLKPYTAEKIETRGKELIRKMGFDSEQSFISFISEQTSKF